MKLKLPLTLLLLLATASPALSHPSRVKHRHPHDGQPIREKKRHLIRLSGHTSNNIPKLLFNPTIGLDYSYNLNRYFAIGGHVDSLINVNNFGANLRAYLYKTSGAPYVELNGGAALGGENSSGFDTAKDIGTSYYANLLMGYEYRNQSGFTWGAAIGPGLKYNRLAVETTAFLGWAF